MNIFNVITIVIMMIQFLILTDIFHYSGCGVISNATFACSTDFNNTKGASGKAMHNYLRKRK